ncbi:MAG: DUF1552 domain-containing protein [Planctomycetes bacterium]|nr:DUF1552 domain-containing protein [Planctomycetota bacterium]
MANQHKFHRRNFLRGAGACLALPALEALAPAARAATVQHSTLATTASGLPLRTAFLMVPDGVNVEHWRPQGVGVDYQLGKTFAPLSDLKDKFQVFTGFEHKNATALGDGGGDHARANAAFLTGVHPFKTAGANFRNGISVDQIAAQKIGHLTRLKSLQLGCEKGRSTGDCDTGYSCAYQFNLSWASPTLPLAPEVNPRAVFEQIFGAGAPAERQRSLLERQARRRSILDLVNEQTKAMSSRLGGNDRHKLDEYLDSVRTIEQQIEQAERFPLPTATVEAPTGIPKSYQDHMRLMFDLLAISFQTDSTRLATFPLAHEGSNRSFPELDISEGHHHLSHHKNKPDTLEKIAKIDHFYMQQLAYFLRRLEELKDPDGSSVLDNSMIVYGCAIGDGNRHNHNDLPIVIAGGGGGTLTPDRHVDFGRDVPMTNLYLSMLDRMGIRLDRFGDSTGRVKDL